MKTLSSFIMAILIFTISNAQPCKTVKPGMTRLEVIKLAGAPTGIEVKGPNNGTDTLALWNYGNQQVVFSGSKVYKVIVDVRQEEELKKKLAEGAITKQAYTDQLKKINNEGCK